jgi:hypothetical protein
LTQSRAAANRFKLPYKGRSVSCGFLPLAIMSKFDPGKVPEGKRTFAGQDKLPKLPIPPLEDTCQRYLEALKALQNEHEHQLTTAAVKDFLEKDGPRIQEVLIKWAENKDRCVTNRSLGVALILASVISKNFGKDLFVLSRGRVKRPKITNISVITALLYWTWCASALC